MTPKSFFFISYDNNCLDKMQRKYVTYFSEKIRYNDELPDQINNVCFFIFLLDELSYDDLSDLVFS